MEKFSEQFKHPEEFVRIAGKILGVKKPVPGESEPKKSHSGAGIMMQLAIQEPYMLTVQPDDFFISPRKLDENFGTMVCFHRRYDLGDEHNYDDNEDFLKDLYLKTVGNDEKSEENTTVCLTVFPSNRTRLSEQENTPVPSIRRLWRRSKRKYRAAPISLRSQRPLP